MKLDIVIGSLYKVKEECITWNKCGSGASQLGKLNKESIVMVLEVATKETRNDNFPWIEYKILENNGKIFWIFHNENEKCLLKKTKNK